MKKLLILLVGINLFASCSEIELPLPFMHLLHRTKMFFIIPDGYKQIEPKQNEQVNWDLAYLHPRQKFEIRYTIRPMDILLKKFKENTMKHDSSNNSPDPNKLYLKNFKTTLDNISSIPTSEYTIFSANAAKNEFNADWGATAVVNVNDDFGRQYKYCFMVFIHKKDIGDAYIFCLADDMALLNNEMKPIIHNLKFNYLPND